MSYHPLTFGRELQVLQAGNFLVIDTSYAPLRVLPRHGHEGAALCFSVRGTYEESVGGQTFECEPYDVMVRPPAMWHSNRYAATGTRCVLISVPQECVLRLRPFTNLFDAPRRMPPETSRAIATRIHRELMAWDDASHISMEGLVLELIGESSRPQRRGSPRWLMDARDYIHAHWTERPSLTDIARAGGVHPASLVRGFRAHLRCSPGEYVRRVRLEHARNAVVQTTRPIAEIALEAGFYDQSHFTSAFRKHFGVTPAQLRSS